MAAALMFRCEHNGFAFDYPLELTPEEEASPIEAINGFTAWLKDKGLVPAKAAPAPARSAPASAPRSGGGYGGGRSSGGGSRPAPARGGGYGRSDDHWECPEHGSSDIGPGYQGVGTECKVTSDEPTDWTKDKSFMNREGYEMWYCKFKSTPPGGRR